MAKKTDRADASSRSAFSVLIYRVAVLSVALAASTSLAQQRAPAFRRSALTRARPATPLGRALARPRNLTGATSSVMPGHTPLGLSSGGLTSSDLNGFVSRPRLLLMDNGFAAPIRRMSLAGMTNTLRYNSTPAEIEAKIKAEMEALKNPEAHKDNYAERLLAQIRSERRHLLADGWGYFKDGDNLRARCAFEAAELVDPRAPAPRFGQIVVDVERRHYRRAVTQLAKLVTYDHKRRDDMPGMFEYKMSLQKLYSSEDDLRTALLQLGRFAQLNPTTESVQALHCLMLWYSGYDDARIEAAGIASRLKRTAADPHSAWAHFHDMVQTALRKRELAAAKS